jgi:hypothetical protein
VLAARGASSTLLAITSSCGTYEPDDDDSYPPGIGHLSYFEGMGRYMWPGSSRHVANLGATFRLAYELCISASRPEPQPRECDEAVSRFDGSPTGSRVYGCGHDNARVGS